MQIVLEGPDNAGKSTLAAFLSERLGLPIQHSGGPSKYPGEVNERAQRFNADTSDLIYDRHPCVSQNIYQAALKTGGELVIEEHLDAFYKLEPFIIYCRNERGVEGHQMSEHSSEEYFRQVERNMDDLCLEYDAWGLDHANLIYRIGDNMEDVANACAAVWFSSQDLAEVDLGKLFDPWQDILEFHKKFELEYDGPPRQLPFDLQDHRDKFHAEELNEYGEAVSHGKILLGVLPRGAVDDAEITYQLEKQLDALVDLTYVILGTAQFHGFDFPEAWRRVHAANMAKVRKINSTEETVDSGRPPKYDVVKPMGWTAPSHTDLVEQHAHRGTNG